MEEHSYTGHRKHLWTRFEEGGLRNGFVHDYEKLEFLLTFAIPRRDTKPMAHALIKEFGSLAAVVHASPKALRQVPGIGKRAAQFLKMLQEFTVVMDEAALMDRDLLDAPGLVKTYLHRELAWEEAEYLLALYLDTRNRLLRKGRLFRGTLDQVVSHPRELVKEALACNAAGVIVAHNHPSGDEQPSREDVVVTQALAAALKTVGIDLLDHFVIGRDRVVGMVELGLYRGT